MYCQHQFTLHFTVPLICFGIYVQALNQTHLINRLNWHVTKTSVQATLLYFVAQNRAHHIVLSDILCFLFFNTFKKEKDGSHFLMLKTENNLQVCIEEWCSKTMSWMWSVKKERQSRNMAAAGEIYHKLYRGGRRLTRQKAAGPTEQTFRRIKLC